MTEQPRLKSRIALGLYFFAMGLCFGSWASRIPDIKASLQLSEGALGSILLMLPLGQMTMMPFSGRIAAKFGSKNILRVAIMAYIIMLSMIGQVSHAWQLAACLYLFGLCGNLCNISVNTQGVQLEKIYERPIFASFHGIWSVGGFSGAAIGLLMMRNEVSPALHLPAIAASIVLVNVLCQQFLLPKSATTTAPPKLRFRMPKGILLQLGFICFCCMSVEGCMFDWSGVYFKEVIQTEERFVSLGYAAFMITMATGRFMGDRLAERFGRKNMVMYSGLMIFSGLVTLIGFPLLIPATIGCMVVGFGVSSIIPLLYSTVGRLKMIPSSIAIATVAGTGYFGFLMGPPIIGYIAELISLRYSFALIALAGLLITFLIRRVSIIS
jgi:MFS family permease